MANVDAELQRVRRHDARQLPLSKLDAQSRAVPPGTYPAR